MLEQNAHSLLNIRISRVLIGPKLHLVASTEAFIFSARVRVQGYIPESGLLSQAKWSKLTPQRREALEADCLAVCGPALEDALRSAIEAATKYTQACESEGLQPNFTKLQNIWAKGPINLALIEGSLAQSLEDLRATKRQRDLAAQIAQTVKLSDYPETFPAFFRKRKLIAVLGPTNSGKTYEAFQRLSTARSGVYLGPLRLLALEAFARLNEEFGVAASLITGEERRIVEGSRVTASTIEMLDSNKVLEVAVIDEIQLLEDTSRGWAWTQAVLGANAEEVWLLGALSAEPAIKALAARLGLPLEIRKKERKHPLKVADKALAEDPRAALRKVKPGDACIVFSRRDALNLRDDLLAMKQSVACIYGALSPEVREREARRFASGEADILVATDAVGMGLNLPIQRVIFTAVQKYDGFERAELPVPLLQQIAGRAGRYGHHSGEEGVAVGLTPAEHQVVAELMKRKQERLATTGFMITPGSAYIEQIARMAGDSRLAVLLSLFALHADQGDQFFKPHVPEEQLSRAEHLDALRNLDLSTKHTFSLAPMASTHPDIDYEWQRWAQLANLGKPIKLDFLPRNPNAATLEEAETMVRLLAAYRWFGYRLPALFIAHEEAQNVLSLWIAAVDAHLKSKSKQGVGGGRNGKPSWYWG